MAALRSERSYRPYSAATPGISVGSSRRMRVGRWSAIRVLSGNRTSRSRNGVAATRGAHRKGFATRRRRTSLLRMRLERMRSGGRIMPRRTASE